MTVIDYEMIFVDLEARELAAKRRKTEQEQEDAKRRADMERMRAAEAHAAREREKEEAQKAEEAKVLQEKALSTGNNKYLLMR
jgi:hypothetical protein